MFYCSFRLLTMASNRQKIPIQICGSHINSIKLFLSFVFVAIYLSYLLPNNYVTNCTEELMPLLRRKYVCLRWSTKPSDITIRFSVKNGSCYHVLGLFNIYFAIMLPVGEEHHFVYHRGGLRLCVLCVVCGVLLGLWKHSWAAYVRGGWHLRGK